MSESESIKADIAFHEKMFFAAFAILVALFGWTATNYMGISIVLLASSLVGCVVSSVFLIYQYRTVKQLIKELKDA